MAPADQLSANLARLRGRVGACELRLDLGPPDDQCQLDNVVVPADIAWVATCRPRREGGEFVGSEQDRLDRLRAAVERGAALVDLEWDTAPVPGLAARVIVSRHWFAGMPEDLRRTYLELRTQGDIVKLVVTPQHIAEVATVFELLQVADSPVVAMAMGAYGPLTRLIAPCFPACAYVYVADEQPTAPGQLTLAQFERTWCGRRPEAIELIELVPDASPATLEAETLAPPGVLRVPFDSAGIPPQGGLRQIVDTLAPVMPRPVRIAP